MPNPNVLLLSSVVRAIEPVMIGLNVPAPNAITQSAKKTAVYEVIWLVRK